MGVRLILTEDGGDSDGESKCVHHGCSFEPNDHARLTGLRGDETWCPKVSKFIPVKLVRATLSFLRLL